MLEVMYIEEAAVKGRITSDEYLDAYGTPRRPWPEVKDTRGQYCVMCQYFFERGGNYRTHMRVIHREIVHPLHIRRRR